MRAALRWPGIVLYGTQFRLARVVFDYVAGVDPSGVELVHALADLLPRPAHLVPSDLHNRR